MNRFPYEAFPRCRVHIGGRRYLFGVLYGKASGDKATVVTDGGQVIQLPAEFVRTAA